jgi:hypothetical protein
MMCLGHPVENLRTRIKSLVGKTKQKMKRKSPAVIQYIKNNYKLLPLGFTSQQGLRIFLFTISYRLALGSLLSSGYREFFPWR